MLFTELKKNFREHLSSAAPFLMPAAALTAFAALVTLSHFRVIDPLDTRRLTIYHAAITMVIYLLLMPLLLSRKLPSDLAYNSTLSGTALRKKRGIILLGRILSNTVLAVAGQMAVFIAVSIYCITLEGAIQGFVDTVIYQICVCLITALYSLIITAVSVINAHKAYRILTPYLYAAAVLTACWYFSDKFLGAGLTPAGVVGGLFPYLYAGLSLAAVIFAYRYTRRT